MASQLRCLDVIWAWDPFIEPAKWKMWVCVAPRAGLFLRINSRQTWQPCVLLPLADHPFLERDSYLQCRQVVEATPSQVSNAMAPQEIAARRGIVGRVSARLAPDIRAMILSAETLPTTLRDMLLAELPADSSG